MEAKRVVFSHNRIAKIEQEDFENRLTWWVVIDNAYNGNGYVDYMLPEVEGCGVDAAIKSRCCIKCEEFCNGAMLSSQCRIGTALRKLAAYEDTELTPLEVKYLILNYDDVVDELLSRHKEDVMEYNRINAIEMKDQGPAVVESVDENKEVS